MRKFFSKKVFEPHNSVDSIEDLPRDSEDELDQPEFPQPQPLPQPEQPQPQPQEFEQEEPVPTTSRTLITIRINPLGRPFSNIYQNIESPQYDTYSEESKDHEEVTYDRSKSNKTDDSKDDLNKLRKVEIEPFSIDEQDASESCVVKCFCMRRRR
ncbi:uncharacterized protein LOC121734142 [Aricia agestis]|uniref:uncharacterized protein LOC121734142 n=1 Tax=Aricia agestis TaxID=91739 RepID=UPI001C20518D|nr:uncharacterized protein LOC121734142 [Aricia agestis]